MRPRIMSTKRLATKWVEQLDAAEISIQQHDFIQPIIQLPDTIDVIQKHIALTSKTAVRAWVAIANKFNIHLSHHRVFCTDQATKETATAFNLSILGTAQNATQLADEVLKHHEVKAITFICSDIRRDELPQKLKAKGVRVDEIIGYHTQPTPIEVKDHLDGVLFFSPSGIDSFLSLNTIKPLCFCIGETTAQHAREKGFEKFQVANQSTPESMIQSVIQYYSKKSIHA